MAMLNILAKGEGGDWIFQVIIIGIFLALGAVKQLVEWYKRRQQETERQTRVQPIEQSEQMAGDQQPQGQSVEEIVQTMRQARRPQTPQRPRPIPQATPVPQARRQASLSQRHMEPTASGQNVQAETTRLQRRLKRQQQQVSKRVGVEAGAEVAEVRGVRSVVGINLSDPEEARRGILYSEILGPPVALRKQQGMWDS